MLYFIIHGKKLKVKRGKVNDDSVMDLDFSEKGYVKLSMIKYTKKIIDAFTEEIKSASNSTTADHLFHISE